MKITIPTPCHENWEAMTPEEKGRFCSVCSKTVMDFTGASDEEIIDVFSNSTEEICGNFYASQLNRNLQYSYINSVFVKFATGFILTTGGWASVQAQQNIGCDTLKAGAIDEVVVHTGLGQRETKKMFLGSTTVVSENDLMKAQQNNSTADPSKQDKKEIRIGGARSTLKEEEKPVVVLNGKIVDLKELQQTDPDSIKSINILRDPSIMALYGPKAQNGVIVVTTKKKGKRK